MAPDDGHTVQTLKRTASVVYLIDGVEKRGKVGGDTDS